MEEFFGARPAAPIPVVVNTIDPIWEITGKVSPTSPASDGRRRRKMLESSPAIPQPSPFVQHQEEHRKKQKCYSVGKKKNYRRVYSQNRAKQT
ncbi:hypothetical protein KSP40_PGU014294 [Platanthera guangdongensis]|uniref:Uncharacterized protein n=1 Tax=Platanthera guangdongensis TaxID=2320717 RepID=A0ABR2MVH1_9ASPA